MTLTYWISARLDDSHAYSFRGARRKDVVAQLAEQGLTAKGGRAEWGGEWGPVRKVSVEYDNAFDLADMALGEDGGYWEY